MFDYSRKVKKIDVFIAIIAILLLIKLLYMGETGVAWANGLSFFVIISIVILQLYVFEKLPIEEKMKAENNAKVYSKILYFKYGALIILIILLGYGII